MHPASVAPAACPADTPAAPKTPASSPPCAGRSRIVAPLPAGSAPPRTPLVAPVRIAPRLSSLRLQPSSAEDYLLPDFYSGAAGLSGRFSEGFFHRRLHQHGRNSPNDSTHHDGRSRPRHVWLAATDSSLLGIYILDSLDHVR